MPARSSPAVPAAQPASLAYDLSGTWQTRAWSTSTPPGCPAADISGLMAILQRAQSFTGVFTMTVAGVPGPNTGTIVGSINDLGAIQLTYAVLSGPFAPRTQQMTATVQQSGLEIQGTWQEVPGPGTCVGYAGIYYAINQAVPARPAGQSFGAPSDICGHENGCGYGVDPANLATGNAVWQETDLTVPGPGLPFAWWRTYNSRDTRQGALGLGWSLSYDARLDVSTPSTQITATLEDGVQSVYVLSGTQYLRPQAELAALQANGDGTYQITRPDQSVLRFSSGGQLLSKADSAGRTLQVGYSAGVLSVITDTVGRAYNLTTSSGRVTRLSDPSINRAVVYTYTGNLLTAVQDVRGGVTVYTYTSNLLTAVGLPDGEVRVQNQYDGGGRLTGQRAWTTAPFTITYDIAVPAITETVALTNSYTMTVSRVVTRTQVVDSLGNTTAYDHDQGNRLLRRVDAAGQPILYHLNGNDEFVQMMDPLNRTTNTNYDAHGNLLTVRDPTNQGPDYSYDALNRLTALQDALGNTTTYTYTAGGLPRQTIDPLGAKSTYTYTVLTLQGGITATLRTAEEDALGRVAQYGYNNLGQPTVITNTLNQTMTLSYDGAGRLVGSTDTAGVAECREYDAADHLTAVVRNCVPGQPATAGQNVRTEYGYDALGRQIWTRDANGEVTRTFFDPTGQVRQMVQGCAVGGVPSTTTCDAFNGTTPQWNRPTAYGFDTLGRTVLVTNTLGVATHSDYDALGRAWRTVANYLPGHAADASTNVTTTLLIDAAGQITTTIDPLGRWTVQQYDLAGRATDTIRNYTAGAPYSGDTNLDTHTDYNALGRPITVTVNYVDGVWDPSRPDEDVRQVTRYDGLNRPITVTESYSSGVPGPDPGVDRLTNFRYDPVGNLAASIDPLGRVISTTYDVLNRPLLQIRNCTDGSGQPTIGTCAAGHGAGNDQNLRMSYTYTTQGRQATLTDPLGRVTQTAYDPLGRTITQTLNAGGAVAPANVTTQYAYDALGHTVVITDALNYTQTMVYNSAGWVQQHLDQTSRALTYGYDGLGRQVDQVDANGYDTHAVYDPLSRPVDQVVNWQPTAPQPYPADVNLHTQSVYDAAGRRVAQIAPDGWQASYTLDGLDRTTGVVENAGGTSSPANVATGYGYDRAGRLAVITNALGYTQTRSYNAAGWPIRATDGLLRPTTYGYDAGGRRVSASDTRPLTVTTSYDGLNRVTGIAAAGLTAIALGYDLGRRTGLTDETGTSSYNYDGLDRVLTTTQSIDGSVYSGYDLLGRRTSLGTSTGAPALSYDYDAAGRLLDVWQGATRQAYAQYDAAGRQQGIYRANLDYTLYSYDGANRVTQLLDQLCGPLSCKTVADFQYTLNRVGQATAVAENLGGSTRNVSYTLDGLRRLSAAAETPGNSYKYSYDLVGNRTSVAVNGVQTQSHSYDAADEVSDTGWSYDAAGNLLTDGTTSYSYNGLNRLTSATRSGTTTSYGYNGDGVQATETNGGSTTRYPLDTTGGLPERLGATSGGASTWYVRGWGQELIQETAGGNAWYLADRLGSIRGLTNAAGKLTASYNYDPYGTPEGGAPADYGFAGEPQNGTLGLVQMRARWYTTGVGRFLTTDPLPGSTAQPLSWDRYLYGYDDPTNRTDPTGGCPAQQIGQLNAKSDCDQFIDEVRTIVNADHPDFWASLAYASLNPGHDLRRDTIALFTGTYYTYLPKDILQLALFTPPSNSPVGSLISLVLQIWSPAPSKERHPFSILFLGDINPSEIPDGKDMLNVPYLKQQNFSSYQQAITFIEQNYPSDLLSYGFRSNYWTNTHHFFLGWYYGYAAGWPFGVALNEAVTSKQHRGTGGNPTDSEAGDLGAILGDWFRSSLSSPEQLPDMLKNQICLSTQERAGLLQQHRN